jgi:hypothetical protein
MGRVVRVEFDGSIDEESTELKFFVVTEEIEKESLGNYVIGLENDKESDTFKFAKAALNDAKSMYNSDDEMAGTLVLVQFNDDDEITKLTKVAKAQAGETEYAIEEVAAEDLEYKAAVTATVDGVETVIEEAKSYVMHISKDNAGKYDAENEYLEGFEADSKSYVINVDEGVVVISLLADDSDKDNIVYSATFETGMAALEGINKDKVLVITDSDDSFGYAKYVVTFNNDADREDDLVGIVEEAKENKVGEFILTIDGTTYTFKDSDNEAYKDVFAELEDEVVLFSVETDKDGEEFAIIEGLLTLAAVKEYNNLSRVTEATDKAVVFSDGTAAETFKEDFRDRASDYTFVKVSVLDTAAKEATDTTEAVAREIEFSAVEAPVDAENVDAKFFDEDDAAIVTGEIVWVIEGIDWTSDDQGKQAE